MNSKTVLISGAGIAGPTLAFWLRAAGLQPTLVEHAPTLRSSGFVIDFWGLSYEIAERMGLATEIGRIGYHIRELRIVDSRGERVQLNGLPTIALNDGGTATFVGTDEKLFTDPTTLVFKYTVAPTDQNVASLAVTSVGMTGGAGTYQFGDEQVSHPSLGGVTQTGPQIVANGPIFWAQGVSGDFATASNWTPAVVPGPSNDATIGATGTYTVTSSVNETVDSLNVLDTAATLLINGNSSFSTTNDGTIIADSGSSLSVSVPFQVPLVLGSFENSGTLEATNTNNLSRGGVLDFEDETITNTPQGVIEANGANTFVGLGFAEGLTTIVGGTLETQGANAVIFMGTSSGDVNSDGTVREGTILDGSQPGNPINIEGNVKSTQQAAIGLIGTINNSGVITMEGDFPRLVCEGNVTLEGGGDITLTNPDKFLEFAPSIFGGVLTNVDNTISGSGVIGQIEEVGLGPLVGTFINEAKGTIDADLIGPLLIAGVGPDTNAGLMEATQGGTLLIKGVTIDNFLNHRKGTVEAGQNSTVGLENATITGGFVTALPGSEIAAEQGSNTITGAIVTNAGTIGAEGANFNIVGNVSNLNGHLDANNATLVIDGTVNGGTATIEKTGEIEFGGPSSANVTFDPNADAILKLDQPHAFTGTVSGLTTGDYIDLTNINFADNPTLSYSSKTQVLTVTDKVSHVTDTIKFMGAVGSFSAQSDGSGGTFITDPPPTNMATVSHSEDNSSNSPGLDHVVALFNQFTAAGFPEQQGGPITNAFSQITTNEQQFLAAPYHG